MESNIKSAKKGDFRIAIHKLELDRIKFMLYSYLRIRIKKIEQFASFILDEDNKRQANLRSKLTAEEFAYATEYLFVFVVYIWSFIHDANLTDLA